MLHVNAFLLSKTWLKQPTMEAKWHIRHTFILQLLILFLNHAVSQTENPSEKCATTCEYTDWALDADCKNRGLASVPVECREVESFDLRQNQIRVLPAGVFKGFEKLRFLDIEMIELEEIEPGAFERNVNLIHIYIQLNSLVMIRRHTFLGVPNLRQLFLNNNNIHTVESGAFDGIPNLETLFLSDNNISDIYDFFHNLTMLRYLYIENNNISVIHEGTFKGLSSLRHLSLAGNNLVHIPQGAFDDLKHLRALKLSFNHITSFSPLPLLQRLNNIDLYHNRLTSVTNLTNIFTPPKKIRKRSLNGEKQFLQVFVGENPLNCDCDAEPFRLWMQAHIDEIHSHHRANATCASPEELAKVSLCSQETTLCPLQATAQPPTLPTSPLTPLTDPLDSHPKPTLMPITIAVLSISCVVLFLLLVYIGLTGRRRCANKTRSTTKRSKSSSDGSIKITYNPVVVKQ